MSSNTEAYIERLNWQAIPTDAHLDGIDDYENWSETMLDYFMFNNADGLLTGEWVEPRSGTKDYGRWKATNQKAMGALRMTLGAGPKNQVKEVATAREIWDAMKTYQKTGSLVFTEIVQEVFNITLLTSKDVTDFANKLRKLNNEAARVGKECQLTEPWLVQVFVRGLGPEFDHFIVSFNQSYSIVGDDLNPPITLDLIVKKASEHEKRMQNSAFAAQAAAQLPPQKPRPKCEHCGRLGHKIDTCFKIHGYPAPRAPFAPKGRVRGAHNNPNQARASLAQRMSAPEPDNTEYEDTPEAQGWMVSSLPATDDPSLWQLDSAADYHMAPDTRGFVNFDPFFKATVRVADQNAPPVPIQGRGTAKVLLRTPDGIREHLLYNVWVSPAFSARLLSEAAIYDSGCDVIKSPGGGRFFVKKNGRTIASGTQRGRRWYLDTMPVASLKVTKLTESPTACAAHSIPSEPAIQLWHQRMAHLSPSNIEKLECMVDGVTLSGEPDTVHTCEACVLAKARNHVHNHAIEPGTRKLELLHSDLMGPMNLKSTKPMPDYVLLITDDYTRYCHIEFLHEKSEVGLWLPKWIEDNDRDQRITRIRTDGGGEYCSNRMGEFFSKRGIHHETTEPYTPQQNGLSERQNQTLMQRVRATMTSTDIPLSAWQEVARGVVWLKNRSPVANRDKTPFELWTGKKPNLSHVRILGSKCWVRIPAEKLKKLNDRSVERILVGYEGSSLYRVWNETTGKAETAYSVEFDEQPVIKRPATGPPEPESKRQRYTELVGDGNGERLINIKGYKKDKGILRTPDNIGLDESDTITVKVRAVQADPTPTTGAVGVTPSHAQVHQAASTTASDDEPLAHLFMTEICDQILSTPKSFKQAMDAPEAPEWRQACQKEVDCLLEMTTWTLVQRPTDKPVLRGTWAFRRKLNSRGKEVKKKARWCARGDMQQQGLDYEETFSSVVKSMAYKLLFNRAAVEDLEIEQMDVDVAFLNSDIQEDVYIEQPEGFEDGTGRVCKLNKTLYGLRQSPRAWYLTIRAFFLGLGFSVAAADASVFYNEDLIVAIYIDDLLIFGKNKTKIQHFKDALNKRFSMKDMGACQWYLGIDVQRDRVHRTITLSQKAYIQKVLSDFQMLNCNPETTPMSSTAQLQKAEDGYTASVDFCSQYQSAVGSLLYVMMGTRPDIAYAVGIVSRFSHNPTKSHWHAVQRIFRYLKGTIGATIRYHPNNHNSLLGFTDASYADCLDTRRSTAGYLFTVGSGAISWQSKRASTIATSTTEAEYTGQFKAALEATYLRHLAVQLWPGITPGPTTIYGDNHGGISLARNALGHARTKHFDIKLRKCQELQEAGTVKFEEISTKANLADILTKPLSRDAFHRLAQGLGMRGLTHEEPQES
jgi:hypothetical protein